MEIDFKDIQVSDDHLLLTEIMGEYDINVKQLAAITGRAASRLYKYCSGDATIPSVVWRSVYKLCGDSRIIKLMTGDVPHVVVPLVNLNTKVDITKIENLIAMRQAQIGFESHVLDILADGKIDSKDRPAIEKLKRSFPEVIALQSDLYQAITGDYDFGQDGEKKS